MKKDTEKRDEHAWAVGETELSERVIGAAIAVHQILGVGFQERIYERALSIELRLRGIPHRTQVPIALRYKGEVLGDGLMDFVVADALVLELKGVERLLDVHRRQVVTYLRSSGLPLGLLINFHQPKLVDGIKRVIP